MVDLLMVDRNVDIPPGEAEYRTKDEFVLPIEMQLCGIFPHMHPDRQGIQIDCVSSRWRTPIVALD